jgi:uncharacterized protein
MSGAKILIIDGNEKVRWLLEDHLKGRGYEVVGVENGLEAARNMREGLPNLLLDEEPQPVTPEMVLGCLADQGVTEGVEEDVIAAVCARAKKGEQTCGAERVAVGAAPENGEDVQIEILVDTQKGAGREREDGSIDFHEVNFGSNVREGQLIARRIPPTSGIPGRDVFGGVLAAVDGRDRPLKPGENVEVRREDGIDHFYSTVAGALKENGDEIAVARLLRIQGGWTLRRAISILMGRSAWRGRSSRVFRQRRPGISPSPIRWNPGRR